MIKKQQTPFNLFLHVPAYCKSLCFGNKFFLRYWGHSRYWSILASKILGSDFRFSPLLDSLLAFPDSSKITTSSTLKTARARAIYKSNTQRIQILKQDFTCRGMQFLDRIKDLFQLHRRQWQKNKSEPRLLVLRWTWKEPFRTDWQRTINTLVNKNVFWNFHMTKK